MMLRYQRHTGVVSPWYGWRVRFVAYRGRVPMSWCRCRYMAIGPLRYSRGLYHIIPLMPLDSVPWYWCWARFVGTVVWYQCRGASVVKRSLDRCDTVVVATTLYQLSRHAACSGKWSPGYRSSHRSGFDDSLSLLSLSHSLTLSLSLPPSLSLSLPPSLSLSLSPPSLPPSLFFFFFFFL